MPEYSDPYAYVSCGVLVAHPQKATPFTFGGRAAFGGTVMLLQQPNIVGTLVPTMFTGSNGNQLTWSIVNGSVSGRWQSSDLLANMASIPDPRYPDGGQFICGMDGLYGLFKHFICGLQDITSTRASDDNQENCNSVSMAFGFTAAPVQLGVVSSIPSTPEGCLQDSGLPFQDTCNGP
jgi:hypothetical protein